MIRSAGLLLWRALGRYVQGQKSITTCNRDPFAGVPDALPTEYARVDSQRYTH